jgi:hypothetical protein
MKRLSLISGFFVLGTLTIVGCSSSAEENGGGSAESSSSAGVYVGEANGGQIQLTLPAAVDDTVVLGISAYAEAVGFTEPLTFLTQSLTNTGDSAMAMCNPRIVTSSGETVEPVKAMEFISSLMDLIDINDGTGRYNQGVELYNSVLNSDTALPGATTTGVYVSTSDLETRERVFGGSFTMETIGQGCDLELEPK